MDEIQNLVIKGTYKTPQIDFNQQNGELVLTGRSIPENATQIYQPLLSWITKYIKSPNQTTNFHLKLKYYNSASTFWLIKIIKELTRITQKD